MSAEISVQVTPGNLGICFEDSLLSHDCYRTKVSFVSSESPLAGTIFQGDFVAKVNGVDVHNVDASGMTEMFQQSSQVPRVITVVRPSVATLELIDGDYAHPLPLSDILEEPFVNTSPMKKTMSTCNDQKGNSGRDPHMQQNHEFQTAMIAYDTGNAVNPPSPRAIEETGHYERTESVRNFCDASIAEVTHQVIANAVLVHDQDIFEAEIVPERSQHTTTVQRRRPTSGKRFYVAVLVVLIICLVIMVVAMPLTVMAMRNARANSSQSSQMLSADSDSGTALSSTVPSLRPSVWRETKTCHAPPCDHPEKSSSAMEQAPDDEQEISASTGPVITEPPTAAQITEPPTAAPLITEPPINELTQSLSTQGLTEEIGAPQLNTSLASATPGPTPEPTPQPNPEPTLQPTSQPTESPNIRSSTLSPSDSTPLWMQWLEAHNTRRKIFHDKYGKTYIPLIWSESLASDAQLWADQMNDGNVCSTSTQNNDDVGQSTSAWWSETINELDAPEYVLIDWVDDEKGLDYPDNRKFTQALWRASKYLGCGESIQEFTENGKTSFCRIYVCNYVRKGNCNMGNYHNWTLPMLMDDTSCGVACPSEGCFWDNP